MVVLGGEAVSYERVTPVEEKNPALPPQISEALACTRLEAP